ncbi:MULTISPECIES: WD40 repeat domain-containing protein [Spirulina sp. CCY15215]|uniref:WD40 repeat domain-containing protein n=1 Tax=Spirulina sp. CCY15215 TaxID=2767591 RepID=UPI001951232F|nr:WD40 repeat domain-containing protein [Spirulina major]
MKKAQWIEIGEYLAIAMSVSGTIVALLTERMVYAATPLTLAVGLNLWQRKQMVEEQIRTQIKAEDWASIQYQLTTAIERQDRLENAAEEPNIEVQKRLQELAESIASVEQRLSPIRERQAQLEESNREKNVDIQGQFTALQTAIATVEKLPEDFPPLQEAIANLQQKINSLEITTQQLPQQIESEIVAINATIATLKQDIASLDRPLTPPENFPLPEQIQELQNAIANLQQNPLHLTRESSPTFESAIAEQVEQLHQTVAEIQQYIEQLSQPDLTIDSKTQELQVEIARIQKRLDILPEIAANIPKSATPEHLPPSVPQEYRREAFTPPEASPIPEDPKNSPETEPSTPQQPPLDDLGYELEGGIRGISENLWEFGASIKNIFDRVTTPETASELTQQWECIWEFAGNTEGVEALAIAPNGKILVSPGSDHSLQIWDLATGEAIDTFTGHSDAISGLAFSPDGQQLASSSTDGTLKLWQVETRAEIANLQGHSAPVVAIAFSPHGKTLASGSYDKTIKLWDLGSQKVLRMLQGHWDWVNAIAYSLDGTTLVSSSHDGTIKFWNVKEGEKIGNIAPGGKIYAIAYNRDGTILASGGSDRHIRFWNSDRQEIRNINVLSQVYSLAFSPDGKILVSGTSHRRITLWDVETGQKLALFDGRCDRVNIVAFGDRGEILASGGDDGIVKVWQRIEEEGPVGNT